MLNDCECRGIKEIGPFGSTDFFVPEFIFWVLRFSGTWRGPWPRMSNWGSSLRVKAVHYLTRDETMAIHQGLIDRLGGLEGVRDLGLLESALYRPRTGYYEDLAEMAAALFESLLRLPYFSSPVL